MTKTNKQLPSTDTTTPKKKTATIEHNDLYEKLYESSYTDFFFNQLYETGLSLDDNVFISIREGRPYRSMYLSPDKEGNIRFTVPDLLTGDVEQYTTGQPPHQKIRDWYLTRWQKPQRTEAGLAKYTPVRGSGTRCLFTKPIIKAFKSKSQIKTLFVVEGFKKALSTAVHGIPIIGMNGLTGYKNPGKDINKLRVEIRELLTTCKVQKVVVILDSDLFDLSTKKDKAATARPNTFYRAALSAKTLFEQFADVVLCHPNPSSSKKYGLDDLLFEYRTDSPICSPVIIDGIKQTPPPKDEQKKIIKDLIHVSNTPERSGYFTAYKLSALADYKVKELFFLNNVQDFYTKYRSELLKFNNQRFKFYTHLYQIQGDGTITEAEDDQHKLLNIENRFGKTVRVQGDTIKELANFTMRILFQIDSEDDPKRIVEIINYNGKKRLVEITSKTLVSLTDFQAQMISYGNYIWKGTKDDMLDLMTILFMHEKTAIQINQMGYQPIDRFYAFSNGIVTGHGFTSVDEYGMLEHNNTNYYLPAWSKFNERDYDTFKDLKKFSHFVGKKPATFLQWKNQFTTVFGDAGEIAASFYIATLFSDIVFDHKSGIGFPILWSAGKPKTGKSTICTSLLNMWGSPSEAIGLAGKSTIKYFINRFAQIRNGLIHLDEYSNSKVNKDVKETLKNIYDRIGYGRKAFTNDFRTINTPILSAACVSGEEIPTDNNALFTRAILLLFNKDKFSNTERQEFYKLADMESDGLTHLTVEILRHRELFDLEFDETYLAVLSEFTTHFKKDGIDDRMLKNSAYLVASVKTLTDHDKIDFGTSHAKLMQIFYKNITRQVQYLEANTDVSKFWDIIELLYTRGEISEKRGDFAIIDHGTVLAIRLNRISLPYLKEARSLGYEKILDKSTLQNYLSNEPYFISSRQQNGKNRQIRFEGCNAPTTAMLFDINSLSIDLGFPNVSEKIPEPSPEFQKPELTKQEQSSIPFG